MSSSPAASPPRRRRSLFTRLLVAQALTVIALVTLFGLLFYVERNLAVARLVAERWAPALRAASATDTPVQLPTLPPVQRVLELPPLAMAAQSRAPRIAEMMHALRAAGLDAREIAFSRGDGHALVWVALESPGQARAWYGFADDLVEPYLPQRVVVALLVGGIAVVLASALVSRRLARPLEHLRLRMQQHRPDAPADDDAPPAPAAPAEVAAIDEAWREMRDRLARHEQERRLLLAGISHDLRSPLARIRMAAELLPPDAASAARGAVIVRNVEVADRLIESFLDHVRAGELPMDEQVDLAALARGVVEGFARPASELALDAPATLPCARANRLLLERLLQNLIDNALRHGAPPVTLRVQALAGRWRIAVEDQGPGLPEVGRDTLQQAFARGDASRGTPGSGLGLSVVQRVAARLGGELRFEHDGRVHRAVVLWPLSR